MKFKCKELNKSFKSKEALIAAVVKNKDEIIDTKKSQIFFSEQVANRKLRIKNKASKGLETSNEDTDDILKRSIIGNTYFWMDHHDDVHLENTFGQSIKQRGDRIRFYRDHENKVGAKIGRFVSIAQVKVKWRDLGIEKAGETICLIADAEIIKDYDPSAFAQYKNGEIDQHSVGMIYIKIRLAVNNPEYENEYKEYQNHINKIGNREKVDEKGYFWAIYEAKLLEISAVIDGSNEITPTIDNKADESHFIDTEPSKDTQKSKKEKERKEYYLNLN